MVENADKALHFNEYFKVIRNRLWVIFTIFFLTVLSGAYVTEEVLPKIYTAQSQIQIHHRNSASVQGMQVASDKPFDPVDFQAEFKILQSSNVLLPIINDLQLDRIWAKRVYKSNIERLSPLDALNYMNANLHLDYERGTNIIDISAWSEVPKEATDIANAIADRYKTMREVQEDQQNGRGADSLRDQITQQQKTVDQSKAAADKIREDAHLSNVDISMENDARSQKAETELENRKRDLLQSKEDYDARRVLLEQVKDLSDAEFINTMTSLGREDAHITTIRGQALKLESDKENLLKDGFEANHPRILAIDAELARQNLQIKELVAGTRRAMEVDTKMAQSRITLLQKEVDDQTTKIRSDQGAFLQPYREAQREFLTQQAILDSLNVKLKQVMIDRSLLENPVTIIQRAEVPGSPTYPKKGLYLGISVVAGLFVGVVVAFLIEFLDTSVKTMADAESLLGIPVLSVIPNKGGPLPLTREAAQLPHAEGYRILRARLDLKVENGLGPCLSMLSGGPGEGKSTTIYNLAVVCAQAGQNVILVDADMRRPTLHELIGVSNDHGLADYLRGEGESLEYIQATALPNLHILASGDMKLAEIGQLAGDKIRIMLDDLKQRYDVVLIDSPPILGISDGSIIAREVDSVVLVIQHRRYPREISLRAKRAIEEVHGNCIGMVLNSVAVKSDDSYYYYSDYGKYYKKADRDRKRKTAGKAKANGKPVTAGNRKKELDPEEF